MEKIPSTIDTYHRQYAFEIPFIILNLRILEREALKKTKKSTRE